MTVTLELGGKPRTFHFGTGFLGNCLEVLGDIGFEELFEKMGKNPFKYVPIMMYESYKFNLWLDDKEPDCTQKDFVKWISLEPDGNDGPMNKWIEAFTESRTKHLPKDAPELKGKGKRRPVKNKS